MSTPLHVVSLGASGSGKTHLQERVGELIPEEDRIELTSLSENALYYFGQHELRQKLLLIEDLDGAESVLYPLRELQSKKRISKTIVMKDRQGKTKAVRLQVEGPVSVAGCTTKERIYEDNANRSFLLYLDTSLEQDDRIMRYQRRLHKNEVNQDREEEIREQMKNCQRVLQPLKVINPFALEMDLPSQAFKPRRTNAHYLDFIAAITFYHQYQRPHQVDSETGEVYIETTQEDIRLGNELLKMALLRKCDELSGVLRAYLEKLKQWLRENQRESYCNREIREYYRLNPNSQKRWNRDLLSYNYVKRLRGTARTGFEYAICKPQEYDCLQQSVSEVLDSNLTKMTSIKGKGGSKQ